MANKMKKIIGVTTTILCGFSISFAADTAIESTSSTTDTAVVTEGSAVSAETNLNSDYYSTPFINTWGSVTNKDNSWGPQDRSGQSYIGVGVSGFANSSLSKKGSNSGWNGIIGYNFNKYFAIQYNQFGTYNGMFGGLGEGVINLSNDTMFTPYALGGAGWGNLSGTASGAWDVGGGLKFELSKYVQASIDYRYIQTIAPNPARFSNSRAGATNMIGAGLVWFFGGNG